MVTGEPYAEASASSSAMSESDVRSSSDTDGRESRTGEVSAMLNTVASG
jgi:hypothetical protein